MNKSAFTAASAALAMVGAQPCLAADDLRAAADMERRSDRFAGASFKLPLGGLTGTKPTARLQFGMRHVYKDARAVAPAATYNVAALEIGASSAGKPALFVGGRELSKVDQRLNAQGGSTALIVGGVVLLALVGIAMVAWSQDEDDTLEW